MQQMREAFPWDQAPRYLMRDRDAIYGTDFAAMTRAMGMEEVLTAPRSPWQNPFVERLVGSIRRECLDHVIVWNERSLRRTLRNYFAYYQRSRTHLALGKDAPESRAVEPPEQGRVVAIPQVADYTTDISDALLSLSKSVASTFAFLERKCRFSLIYATKLLLIKPDSFATRTPCSWMHSTTGRGRDCQALDSDVLANRESASTRSAISVPQECGLIRTEFSVGTGK